MTTPNTPLPRCTCAVKPESGYPHEADCPITPLRDAAIARAADVLASIRITAKKSA